jgi:hypothetical protein
MDRDPSTIRWLLAVDPGCGVTAWALSEQVEPGAWVLTRVNRIRRPSVPKLVTLMAKLLGLGVDWPSLHLVAEGQWFRLRGKNPGYGHASVQALAEQRRTWEVVVELQGGTYEQVDPSWLGRASKGCEPCADFASERESTRRLITAGRLHWPGLATAGRPGGPGPDEWAAVMLGTYWVEAHGQRITRPGATTVERREASR